MSKIVVYKMSKIEVEQRKMQKIRVNCLIKMSLDFYSV